MKGQIEEQHGADISCVREAYKNAVSWVTFAHTLNTC